MNDHNKLSNVDDRAPSNIFPHGWRTKNNIKLYLYDLYGEIVELLGVRIPPKWQFFSLRTLVYIDGKGFTFRVNFGRTGNKWNC